MAGNLRDWTESLWDPGESTARFLARGGSFVSEPRCARACSRVSFRAENRSSFLGLRLALDLP